MVWAFFNAWKLQKADVCFYKSSKLPGRGGQKVLEAKHHIEVKVDMDELDLTSAEAKAMYKEIQEWV